MSITPSKFIKCKVLSNGTISNNVTTGFYQQTGVVLQITPTIIGTKTFDYRDIKNGNYITSNSQAKCMQISNIVVTDAANGKISCTLTDATSLNGVSFDGSATTYIIPTYVRVASKSALPTASTTGADALKVGMIYITDDTDNDVFLGHYYHCNQ